METLPPDRHGIDPRQSNLIHCPRVEGLSYVWGEGPPRDGDPPPHCPCCGIFVVKWATLDEWDQVIDVRSDQRGTKRIPGGGPP